jgi:HEPN domain-containing protein
MNPLTLEWVNKAEEDFTVAGHLLRVRKASVYSAACFHCQQCAEKYLKAVLQERQQTIPKIHNLADLLTLVTQIEPSYEFLRPTLDILEDYAVDFRYPGMNATKDDAKTAFKAIKAARQLIRQRLGLA